MDSAKMRTKIGTNIRQARTKAGLTQLEVAEKAGISVNHYALIERGEVNQSLETFEAILKVLKVKSTKILPF